MPLEAHARAGGAREVDARVVGRVALERIGALAVERGDVSGLDRASARDDLPREFARQDQALQRRELAAAVIDLRAERVDHGVQRRHDRTLARARLGAAERRRLVEIELAALELRDFGQVLAERVQAQQLGLHLADPRRECRDLVVDVLLDARELHLLRGEILLPACDGVLGYRPAGAPAAAGIPGADRDHQGGGSCGRIREQALGGHNVLGTRLPGASPDARKLPKKALKLKYFRIPVDISWASERKNRPPSVTCWPGPRGRWRACGKARSRPRGPWGRCAACSRTRSQPRPGAQA